MRPAVALGLSLLSGSNALACQQRASAPSAELSHGPRVVSLHDVTTELMVELAAVDRLIGIQDPVDLTDALAEQVAAVPRVGGLESILALRPSLVLGLGVVAERDPELVVRLRQAGVEVHLVDPARLDDVFELIGWVAGRVGAAERGAQLLAGFRAATRQQDFDVQTPTATRAQHAQPSPAAPLRVFVYDCCDPPFTAGGATVLTDLIARAGGRNVFGELAADWTHVSWEEVASRKPELIVVHAYRYDGQGDVADKQRALRAIPSLAAVPTSVLPLGCSLGGLRSAEGISRLRSAMRSLVREPS
jgi:iron complex transport system substrate-binding protein